MDLANFGMNDGSNPVVSDFSQADGLDRALYPI